MCRSIPPIRPSGWPTCSDDAGLALLLTQTRLLERSPAHAGSSRRASKAMRDAMRGSAHEQSGARVPARQSRLCDLHLGLDGPPKGVMLPHAGRA